MHMRHKPPIGKGAPTMKRHAHRGGCCAGRPIPKSAKSEPLSGFVFFAGAPISSECGISRGRPPRGGSFFCISRLGKAYSSRYWGSALHRRLRRAPLLGRCGFLRRPNPAAETSRVLWSFRGRFVSRWGGNRNIGGGNLSQGALAPSVCSASCAVVPHRKVWGIKSDFSENARVLAVSGMGAASGVRGVVKRRGGKSVKNSFAMASDLRVCSGVSHREV